MAAPLSPQIVDDLKQNFFWSYISQDEENFEVLNLEINVEDFLQYIDIDLSGVDPYSQNDLVSLHYGLNTKALDPGTKYFTYMLTNSEINGQGDLVNLGIIGNANEFLLLKENSVSLAVNAMEYLLRKEMYMEASIYSPYVDEATVIDSFTNHPLICSFPKEDFRTFILNNMSSPTMDLSTLILVFQMGATYLLGINPDYKVETAIVITKDTSGIRLDSINYTDKPFKFKAMDVGGLCPPSCG